MTWCSGSNNYSTKFISGSHFHSLIQSLRKVPLPGFVAFKTQHMCARWQSSRIRPVVRSQRWLWLWISLSGPLPASVGSSLSDHLVLAFLIYKEGPIRCNFQQQRANYAVSQKSIQFLKHFSPWFCISVCLFFSCAVADWWICAFHFLWFGEGRLVATTSSGQPCQKVWSPSCLLLVQTGFYSSLSLALHTLIFQFSRRWTRLSARGPPGSSLTALEQVRPREKL